MLPLAIIIPLKDFENDTLDTTGNGAIIRGRMFRTREEMAPSSGFHAQRAVGDAFT